MKPAWAGSLKKKPARLYWNPPQAAVGDVLDQVLPDSSRRSGRTARKRFQWPWIWRLAALTTPGLPASARVSPDIGEPPFLLQPGDAGLVERPLVGEHPLLPAGQEDVVELQPLGGVQGHHGDHCRPERSSTRVHHQPDMLQEAAQAARTPSSRRISSLQILQPALGVGRLLLLPHRGIAALVQHLLRQFPMRAPSPPASRQRKKSDSSAISGLRAPRLQLVGNRPASPSPSSAGRRATGRPRWMVCRVVAPMPRLGTLTMRSNRQVVGRLGNHPENRPWRRGFPAARRSAGRRSPAIRAGRWSGTAPRTRASGSRRAPAPRSGSRGVPARLQRLDLLRRPSAPPPRSVPRPCARRRTSPASPSVKQGLAEAPLGCWRSGRRRRPG